MLSLAAILLASNSGSDAFEKAFGFKPKAYPLGEYSVSLPATLVVARGSVSPHVGESGTMWTCHGKDAHGLSADRMVITDKAFLDDQFKAWLVVSPQVSKKFPGWENWLLTKKCGRENVAFCFDFQPKDQMYLNVRFVSGQTVYMFGIMCENEKTFPNRVAQLTAVITSLRPRPTK